MEYQFAPLHGWLLPPHPVGRHAGARAVAASSTKRCLVLHLPRGTSRYFGAADYS